MNRELDDLVSQADQQLQQLEVEYLEKEASRHVDEVSHETAVQFNLAASQSHSRGLDHTGRILIGVLAFVLQLAAQIYLWVAAPNPVGPYHLVIGTVQDSSIVRSSHLYYGSVAVSKVRLPDGHIITIRLATVRLLPAGTPVTLRVYDTGAVRADRLL